MLRAQGGSVQFHAGNVTYASTELLSNSEKDLRDQRREEFQKACRRQNLTLDQLLLTIQSWKGSRLIVVGDTIMDQYAACEAIGMSAEAPVIVVRELAHKNYLGAAAIVAAHIQALGAECDLVSVVGDDDSARIVQRELDDRGIGAHLFVDSSRPTTFKKRYVVENQKLFRVSRLEQHDLDLDVEQKIISCLETLAPSADGIVVSDFVYGVITRRILESITLLSDKYSLPLFGDVQCSSQQGSISRFKRFTLLCPNERELRLALKDASTGIERLSQRLIEECQCRHLLVKLSGEGFIAYDKHQNGLVYSQPFPALSVNPLDVAGAGDSVLAVMATGMASGQSMMPNAALACCMAGLAVETMGNTPITWQDLLASVQEMLN